MYLISLQKVVPSDQYPQYAGIISSVAILSQLLGPIIGGSMASHSSWRWVFWIKWVSLNRAPLCTMLTESLCSIPIGCVAILLAMISLPSDFPSSDKPYFIPSICIARKIRKPWKSLQTQLSGSQTTQMLTPKPDFIGAFLLLSASIMLVFALETGGNKYPWKSIPVTVSLTSSSCLWFLFFFWERLMEIYNKRLIDPIFPIRLTADRFFIGVLL